MNDNFECNFDDNFVAEINRDLESIIDDETPKLLDTSNSIDDENLESHIQNTLYPNKESFPILSEEEKIEIDSRSIYVGNVDYSSTAKELEIHFNGCGAINKITILTNKFTGHPKGFAYIEFENQDSVDTAMLLDESEFRQRQIKVMPKRTNIHGFSTTNRPPRRGRSRTYAGFGQSFNGRPRTSRFRRHNPTGYAPY